LQSDLSLKDLLLQLIPVRQLPADVLELNLLKHQEHLRMLHQINQRDSLINDLLLEHLLNKLAAIQSDLL
jgi:hypothetical protein